ncbi:MAG: acetyltransferase [Clostridia bacterium]|nr:acetyltransferase [Clostridia bacterium]
MKDLIIIGAGGVGRETAMLIRDINKVKPEWNVLGFVDDDEKLSGTTIEGTKVIGSVDFINSFNRDIYVICSVSNPKIKQKIISRLDKDKLRFARLIHPTAVISDDCVIGEDVIIQAYCVITTNVNIGSHVQINPQCGIGHDSEIRDYTSLYWNVNISGNVTIGEGCILGTKATIIQGLRIGDGAIIGSSANVIRDMPANSTAVGNPARVIKSI